MSRSKHISLNSCFPPSQKIIMIHALLNREEQNTRQRVSVRSTPKRLKRFPFLFQRLSATCPQSKHSDIMQLNGCIYSGTELLCFSEDPWTTVSKRRSNYVLPNSECGGPSPIIKNLVSGFG